MNTKLVLVASMILPLVLCQTGQFEQECNILQTLETLQSRLDSAEARLQEQGTELADTRSSLTDTVTELADTRSSLTDTVTELADTRSSLANAETRLQDQGRRITQLDTGNADTRSSLTDAVAELAETRGSLTDAVTQINQQNAEIDDLKAFARRNKGSTYVRWGRTSCPGNGSELVYTGYAGGSHWTHSGAAVDYLCLPTDPSFAHYEDAVTTGSAYVYGAEYEFAYRSPDMAFFPDNDQTINLHDKDVPCAVCRTVRSAVLMVPARTTCHDGWTLEYNGYLSAGRHAHVAATQYVCLDDQPEYLTGGAANNDGKLFYFVEGRCGSLGCPPYVDGRELTCAVCSI